MSGLSRAYLLCYNTVQLVGWTYLLGLVVSHLVRGAPLAHLYTEVATVLQVQYRFPPPSPIFALPELRIRIRIIYLDILGS
jgi:hypothetical protein